MTAREADEVRVGDDARTAGRAVITVMHGRYETSLNVSADEIVRLRAAIDAHLSTPPVDDVRELADHLNGMMDSLDESVTHEQVYEQLQVAWKMALALRPRGPVTDVEVLAGLNAEGPAKAAAPSLDYYGAGNISRMRNVLAAAREARP